MSIYQISIFCPETLAGGCDEIVGERLGVEDGRIPTSQLSASSVYCCDGVSRGVECGRLNGICGYGGWLFAESDPDKWFQVKPIKAIL